MRVGAIDIGTNTILLLIADVQPDGSLVVVRDEHAIARLGKDVDANRMILLQTSERALEFLRPYQALMTAEHVDAITVCGTSFLRDALNRQEFIEFVNQRLGFTIEVLSGDEEATLTYRGAVSEFWKPGKNQEFAVLDIGGGSTELTIGTESNVVQKKSLDIGCVRITERILKTSPPSLHALQEARDYVRERLRVLPAPPQQARMVGVAGTLTTLAAMDLGLQRYDRTAVSGHVMKRTTVLSIFDDLRTKSLDEIKSYPQILPERADILLAGILILAETLEVLERLEIIASDRGLRFGMALRAAQG